mmetsp:Transcript_47913/g.72473  ORF Transcript_47913/g.72473 Transcript_47913/m.72473 type:complete len:162 (+) Transcript_47913:18-503(+)
MAIYPNLLILATVLATSSLFAMPLPPSPEKEAIVEKGYAADQMEGLAQDDVTDDSPIPTTLDHYEKCPCGSHIKNLVTLIAKKDYKLTVDSCSDVSYAKIQVQQENPKSWHPIGTFARFNDAFNEGECAEGDAIRLISQNEAEACISLIMDSCRELGHTEL